MSLLALYTIWNVASVMAMKVNAPVVANNSKTVGVEKENTKLIKEDLNNMGVHFNKTKMYAINTKSNVEKVLLNNSVASLKKNKYVTLNLNKPTGIIAIQRGMNNITFEYEIKDNMVSVKKVLDKDISFDSKKYKKLSVKTLTEKQTNNVKHNEKIVELSSNNDNNNKTNNNTVSNRDNNNKTIDSSTNALANDEKNNKMGSSSNSNSSSDIKVSDGTSQARSVWLSICDYLNLGSLKSLLVTAQSEAVSSAKLINMNGKKVYFITSQNGYGITGVKRSDLMQASELNINSMKLNLNKAVSQSGWKRVVVDSLHTVLYKDDLTDEQITKMIGAV